jgi:hypothetical protein
MKEPMSFVARNIQPESSAASPFLTISSFWDNGMASGL